METAPHPDDSGVFVARALPQSRAWLSLIFLGSGVLSIGGVIEFATGSPMTAGQGVSNYFAVLFAFHSAAFCGAALIGTFPALAVPRVKAVWLVSVAVLYAAAFAVWRGHPSAGGIAQWFALTPPYLPALAPLAAGALWRNNAVLEVDAPSRSERADR